MQLRLRSITWLTDEITGFELVDPRGRDLPRFTAGAHVSVRLGHDPGTPGMLRDYSLWNDPGQRRRYAIAVRREPEGRASRHLHDAVRVGDLVEVSPPRNHFPLAEAAERHLFLAGGIGITPIMAMIAELRRRGSDFLLHYCTRAPDATAFRDDLAPLAAQGKVRFHHDGGDPARALDLAAVLRDPLPGTHLYYCGPAGMMAAAAAASAHWPAGSVHREYFAGPQAAVPDFPAEDTAFRVRLARSGAEYPVSPGETIIEVLRRNGIAVATTCELGYCGACLTRYVAGEPEHRDVILDEAGRRQFVLICCSRSKSPVLALDL